ncbi:MAG: hypothetical protein U0Q12_13720 [Vicinamibacterales bacterium]
MPDPVVREGAEATVDCVGRGSHSREIDMQIPQLETTNALLGIIAATLVIVAAGVGVAGWAARRALARLEHRLDVLGSRLQAFEEIRLAPLHGRVLTILDRVADLTSTFNRGAMRLESTARHTAGTVDAALGHVEGLIDDGRTEMRALRLGLGRAWRAIRRSPPR